MKLRTNTIPDKEDLIEIFDNLPNNQALFFFDERVAAMNWTKKELLSLYSNLECPQAQANFDIFYSKLEELSDSKEKGTITLYRGTSLESVEKYGIGHSWTTNKETAEFFANRAVTNYQRLYDTIDETPCVLTMTISKQDIIASIDSRSEEEILIKSLSNPQYALERVGCKHEKIKTKSITKDVLIKSLNEDDFIW